AGGITGAARAEDEAQAACSSRAAWASDWVERFGFRVTWAVANRRSAATRSAMSLMRRTLVPFSGGQLLAANSPVTMTGSPLFRLAAAFSASWRKATTVCATGGWSTHLPLSRLYWRRLTMTVNWR